MHGHAGVLPASIRYRGDHGLALNACRYGYRLLDSHCLIGAAQRVALVIIVQHGDLAIGIGNLGHPQMTIVVILVVVQ